jgi:hypothetical protein
MTCSEVQEVLPELLDVPVEGIFPPDFQSHLKDCPECSDLVSDLRTISGQARQLVANDEPSPQLWLRIAAQLRAEGIIREQESNFQPGQNFGRKLGRPSSASRWRFSWAVPVLAVLVTAGAYVIKHRPAPIVSQQDASKGSNATPVAVAPTPQTTASVPSSPSNTAPTASKASAPIAATSPIAAPSESGETAHVRHDREEATAEEATADDEQFLSVVSSRAPSLKDTYEKQLQAVNADIRESQAYVDQNPGDADARQHLMEAYQQKALLYQIALDRIQ